MPRTNKTIVNMVGGELSPKVYGRVDLPVYQKGLSICENFIVIPQGGARFRNGTQYIKSTRLNQKAVLIPFQFSDQQAYIIEATNKKFRFYKDNGAITETPLIISAATQANPGVLTTTVNHGYAIDDEVFISGVVGMTQLNGKFFRINSVPALNTFSLKTIAGVAVDTTGFTAYVSDGNVARVYEISTPYLEVDLGALQWAQSADTMYITNQRYEPRKLTRTGHAAWTLATYTRTADPFSHKGITAISNANPAVFTSTGHGFVIGDPVSIGGNATGAPAIYKDRFYTINTITANTFTLKDENGVPVSGVGNGAFAATMFAVNTNKCPRAVTFLDTGRLLFGGTATNPETFWASQAPTSGAIAFDNFTTGTGATDAITYTLAPVHGKVDSIQWVANTSKFVVIGTFGTIRRLYGAVEQEPISPTSLTAKSVNSYGCAATLPVSNGASLFYIQRGDALIRSFEYDISIDGYTTTDRNLVAEHITKSGIKRLVEQQGFPDIIWADRNDGRLAGLTFKEKEDISGWHRHYFGGSHVNDNAITVSFSRILSVGIMPRPANPDQTYFVVERKINNATTRTVEFFADEPVYPIREDFFSGDEIVDVTKYKNALFEIQKDAIHLDMSISYDGSAIGLAANASVTPSAITGVGITVTASAAVFTAAMVGREIWKKYDLNGDGGGRAKITAFTDSTHVTCDVLSNFNNVTAIPVGSWFLTTNSLSGLDHVEGETVRAILDGGPGNTDGYVVVNGAIALDFQVSKVHIGYLYKGHIRTLNIDTGGVTGSAQAKPRNLIKAFFRFLNTLGVKYGTNIYRQERIIFRSTADNFDRPTPPFSGLKEQTYSDNWEESEKIIEIFQENPLPCTITSIDVFMETADD